jgi:hypothetical protein
MPAATGRASRIDLRAYDRLDVHVATASPPLCQVIQHCSEK